MITMIYTVTVSMCTSSALGFFGPVFISTYFCVALATDTPEPPTYYKVISLALKEFLPAAFVGYAIYHICVKRTLYRLEATVEKTVLSLGSFWVGALNNLTFDRLPIQRLTPHDLLQPGAILSLIVIIVIILLLAVGQIWAFRLEGRLPTYLLFYSSLTLLIVVFILITNMNLRLHHYIIALVFLPGTALQTRPSLIYQGLLVGLFINGIARWGFDSILQVPTELFKTPLDGVAPQVQFPHIEGNNITFSWPDFDTTTYSGLSVLVNDVERFRSYEDHQPNSFSWIRSRNNEPTYFRFGYVKDGNIGGDGYAGKSTVGRYSDPGTWLPDGTWIPHEQSKS